MSKDEQLHYLDVNRLHKSPCNPRLDTGDLTELTESIRRRGVIEPLIVRKRNDGWEVVIGKRRLEAAKQAVLGEVPCIVRKYSDAQAVEVSLMENLWREDLRPIERATALMYLLEEQKDRYPTRAVLATALGVDAGTLTGWLSILEMTQEIQDRIGTDKEVRKHEKVSLSHAQAVKRLEQDKGKHGEWLDKAKESKWSVSQTEQELEKALNVKKKIKKPLFVNLGLNAFVDAVVNTKNVVWDETQRVPDVGESITISTPKVVVKVKKVHKDTTGLKVIVELEGVE